MSLVAQGDIAPAFEIKGSNFTFPVLRLLASDREAIARGLEEHLARAPELFDHAPMVLDLEALSPEQGARIDLALLTALMRGHGLLPVAVRGVDAEQVERAAELDIAVLSHQRTPTRRPPRPAEPAPPSAGARLVTRPVRSGQRVYAARGDLVVLAAVGHGAEILADGNIHVYGPLRGRALAGIKGDAEARIFCQELDAELLSIAGNFKVSDDIDEGLRGRAVQVFLDEQRLAVRTM